MEVVKFNSIEDALKVQAHLHNITIVGSELLHASRFDREALSLAAQLEGLTQNDYQISQCFVGNRAEGLWDCQRDRWIPRIVLEIGLPVAVFDERSNSQLVGVNRYVLSVDRNFRRINGVTSVAIPLIVNEELIRLANIVQRCHIENAEDIILEITMAYFQFNDFRNPSQYHLILRGGGRSQIIQFYPNLVV